MMQKPHSHSPDLTDRCQKATIAVMDHQRKVPSVTPYQIGKDFENMLKVPARAMGGELLRIPNGCRTYFKGGYPRLIRIKSPFDFVLAAPGRRCAFFDAKSTSNLTYNYSDIDQDQLRELMRMASKGNAAGFIIWFRKLDAVRWFDVRLLLRVPPRSGIRPEHGLIIGGAATMDFEAIFVGAQP